MSPPKKVYKCDKVICIVERMIYNVLLHCNFYEISWIIKLSPESGDFSIIFMYVAELPAWPSILLSNLEFISEIKNNI